MGIFTNLKNMFYGKGDSVPSGFHGSEKYRLDVLDVLKPFLLEGMTVYGEIVGYVNGKPIMPNGDVKALKDKAYTKKYGDMVIFKYGCAEHEFKFHIYRITLQCGATVIDFTDAQLKHWCECYGFQPTLDVHEPMVYDGNQEALCELVERLTERPECLTEDHTDPTMISEGVIIRVDYGNLRPKFYKSKSYAFKVIEGMIEAPDEETLN